ncbi:MAG: hypothetical protein IPK72_22405 [Candidatus Eisenbacteria bacterium]|nr:hypothetical protein [Candidatus Eisenbacteria bacterium]
MKAGQVMRAEDVVARTELPGNVQPVKAASILGIHQEDLGAYMLKKLGDHVTKDEIIATAKSFFGLFKAHVKAPVDGTLESISTVTGQLILREAPIPVEVHAYFDGTVTEILPGEGVVMEAVGAFLQGIFGVGGETSGEIAIAVQSPDEESAPIGSVRNTPARSSSGDPGFVFLPSAVPRNSARALVVGESTTPISASRSATTSVASTGHETPRTSASS